MDTPTRDQIFAEPAGPRLDAWIAEYVMGWRRGEVGPPDDSAAVWFIPTGGYLGISNTRRYSTDIDAAWAVVEKVGSPFEMHYLRDGQCCLVRLPMHGEIEVEERTMPLAVCKATLLARRHFSR